MATGLSRFRLKALHGYLDVDVRFDDSRMILVGENGSGKTSILRILFYFLSGRWSSLDTFKFDWLSCTLGNETITLDQRELARNLRRAAHLPSSLRSRIQDAIRDVQLGRRPPRYLEELADRYGVPFRYIVEYMHNPKMGTSPQLERKQKEFARLKDAFAAKVIYLPTYRRIEEELERILGDRRIEERPARSAKELESSDTSLELVQFGMQDVARAITGALETLKDSARKDLETLTLGYLGDIVDGKHDAVDLQRIRVAPDAIIESVLGRVSAHILSASQKQHVWETVRNVQGSMRKATEEARVICHYLLKLLNFQQQLQERERAITSFFAVCNKYFGEDNKRFEYTTTDFSYRIHNLRARPSASDVALQNLSSGEKQIVSLFSHLHLSGAEKSFIIIDEPELSLSVPWQKQFLVDVVSTHGIAGLAAATHSPFVYDNSLHSIAHGLGEFVRKGMRR